MSLEWALLYNGLSAVSAVVQTPLQLLRPDGLCVARRREVLAAAAAKAEQEEDKAIAEQENHCPRLMKRCRPFFGAS